MSKLEKRFEDLSNRFNQTQEQLAWLIDFVYLLREEELLPDWVVDMVNARKKLGELKDQYAKSVSTLETLQTLKATPDALSPIEDRIKQLSTNISDTQVHLDRLKGRMKRLEEKV
jgi:prefoldin subunit 5